VNDAGFPYGGRWPKVLRVGETAPVSRSTFAPAELGGGHGIWAGYFHGSPLFHERETVVKLALQWPVGFA